jgi:hypothetical protein
MELKDCKGFQKVAGLFEKKIEFFPSIDGEEREDLKMILRPLSAIEKNLWREIETRGDKEIYEVMRKDGYSYQDLVNDLVQIKNKKDDEEVKLSDEEIQKQLENLAVKNHEYAVWINHVNAIELKVFDLILDSDIIKFEDNEIQEAYEFHKSKLFKPIPFEVKSQIVKKVREISFLTVKDKENL